MVSFAALDGDPYPRHSDSGTFRDPASRTPDGWGPTLRVLAHPRSELRGRVSDWYYLCHSARSGGKRVVGRIAAEVAQETRDAIAEHVPAPLRPNFHAVELSAKGPPDDYGEVFDLAVAELSRARRRHPQREIVIMLGMGTSAMQAALLLVGATGTIDGPVRVLQVERNQGVRARPDQPIRDVTLQFATVLRIARGSRPRSDGDLAPTWNYDRASSAALRAAVGAIRYAAQVPFPVLIRGERGVGKSTIASFVRASGPFRKRAKDEGWASVACGQFVDSQMMRAELCGCVKGAYTGAADREGLLHLADGDTLFLDEVHDLSEENQRILIRVLEDQKYSRLGSLEVRRSNFRLVTGTNRTEAELARALAPDFYDRIRDLEITVPPLRECREDLSWMWRAEWTRDAARAGLNPALLDDHHARVIARLSKDPLPGNWRDLRRVAVRLAAHIRVEGQIRAREVDELLNVLDAGRAERGTHGAPRPGGERLTSRDVRYLATVHATLGEDFSVLMTTCQAGRLAPDAALAKLFPERGKAPRVARFIRTHFPDVWSAASGA